MGLYNRGVVYCCCPAYVKGEIGNLGENTLMEIWNGPRVQSFRESLLNGNWESVCRPNCPTVNKYLIRGEKADLDSLVKKGRLSSETALEIEQGKTFLDSTPSVFNFSNSNICNLDCVICGAKYSKEDTELLEKTTKELWPYLKKALQLTLTGNGDPFARPDSRKILLELDGREYPNLRFNLVTNGLLIPDYWDRIKHQRFGFITISVDAASKETYEKIRRRGKWEKILEAISIISANKEKFSDNSINMTVWGENYREMPAFVKLGQDYGLNVSFSKARTQGDMDPAANFFESGDTETLNDFKAVLNSINPSDYSVRIDWNNLLPFLKNSN
jgi:sulfatase maturation enzyme AslB (radical SAM superfamily)